MTTQTPHWYMINAEGMATLCASKEDAEAESRESDFVCTSQAPHRAVQLVEVKPCRMTRDELLVALRAARMHITGEALPTKDDALAMIDAAIAETARGAA